MEFNNLLFFQDEFRSNIVQRAMVDQFIIQDQFISNHVFGAFQSTFVPRGTFHLNSIQGEWTDSLVINSGFRKQVEVLFSNIVYWGQEYSQVANYWQDTLNLTGEYGTRIDIQQDLAFTDSYVSTVVRSRQMVDTFNIRDTFVSGSPRCDYPDQVSETVTFQTVDAVRTVNLNLPLIGDKDDINFRRVEGRSRNGTLAIITQPYWPTIRSLQLQWTWLTPTQRDSLETFLNITVGVPVRYIDHRGVPWIGLILNPDAEFNDLLPGYSIDLTFEGRPEGEPIQL